MVFHQGNPRPGDRADSGDLNNPYGATNNPTLVLPVTGTPPPEADIWTTNFAMPGVRPDIVDAPRTSYPLHTGTDDLWGMSTPPDVSHLSYRPSTPATPDSSQSDFLLVGPRSHTIEKQSPAEETPSASISGAPGHSWPVRNAAPFHDPLRTLSVMISGAIERHLTEQNETFPIDRTPEKVDLIRRLTLNYLRHDRTAAEAIPDAIEGERLLAMVIDEVLGYGPLDPLLRDESVTEIMVTGPHMTYVEQGGRLHEVPVHFEDDTHVMRVIHKLLHPIGLTLSPTSPIADGRLEDGSRINVVIPPIAATGPAITIQRLVRRTFTLEQLVRMDMLSLHIADFLRLCVNARLNMLITGITGAGKTALLNAISGGIDESERIVLIEDVSEIQLWQRHVIPLEAGKMHDDQGRVITTAELITNAQHMHPQRIIIGECRTSDAFALVQAMAAGHDGTIATLYANSTRDALGRLEAFALSSGVALPPVAFRQQIATGLDLIVHCARLRDGTRRIVQITDVCGMEGDTIATQDLFVFREAGLDMSSGRIRGEFAATGLRPSFISRIEDHQGPYIAFSRSA
jgi:pilus assembly protein CpaF